MARQAAADRAWQAIARFYKNCREKKPGKKGYPRFQKDNRSVEYKTSGWKLEADGKHLTQHPRAQHCHVATLAWVALHRTAGQAETGRSSERRNASGQKTSNGRKRLRSVKPAG